MHHDKAKHIDFRNMSITPPEVKRMIKKGTPPGQFCTALIEEVPLREHAGCEVIGAKGQNNSYIVLGRDRDASLASGKGGAGGTRCGMIDIVAGHLSGLGNKATGDVISGPNFALDAARIYITQRGNIDKYFSLIAGNTKCKNTDNASGVGIKADHTRLIGRRSVKIYAGKANWEGGGFYGEPNSQGGEIRDGSGTIELIAGAFDDIQPAVKGKNLREALRHIYKYLKALNSAIHGMHLKQMRLNSFLATHVHVPFAASPTLAAGSTYDLVKSSLGGYDSVIKNLNIIFTEMDSCGIGDEKAMIDGNKSIVSSNVFLS